ncbi:SRPBCC family protein, partial [Pseudoalteromonas sp. SG41-6]
PQNYSVDKKMVINADTRTIKLLVSDFDQWHKWSPWQQVDTSIRFSVNEPSAGVGAHQSWVSKWGYGEMTITSINKDKIAFNLLLDNEHIVQGTLEFAQANQVIMVTCHIEGQATTLLISGYMAMFYKYILSNAVTLGLNNLKTVAQLYEPQATTDSHDSKNSTSPN